MYIHFFLSCMYVQIYLNTPPQGENQGIVEWQITKTKNGSKWKGEQKGNKTKGVTDNKLPLGN